ncbi:MAG: carboxypeptidase-like regulatory domain-containing protein [Promethearchaeota archaeon]
MIGASIPIIGQGTISIDHNFGATDNYRVMSSGTPLSDVDIRAFVETDYEAGLRANKYIVGQSRTGTDGRWVSVIRLDPGNYVLEFSKPGQYRTATVDVTVTNGVEGFSVQMMGVQMFSDTVVETYQAPSSLKIQSVSAPIYVDHNYKGKDNLRLMTKGKPIEGVGIKIYKKSDYDGGRITEEFVIQRTVTNKEGRWERSMRLESGEYVVEFSKPGKFSTSVKVLKL